MKDAEPLLMGYQLAPLKRFEGKSFISGGAMLVKSVIRSL
jgi:hypothetical protein